MDFYWRDIDRIKNARSLEDIRTIVRAYSAQSIGEDSTLYSGMIGKTQANVFAVDHVMRTRSSIIDDTPRGRFLVDERARNAIRDSVERILKSQGHPSDTVARFVDDFLYGDNKAPIHSPTSIFNCLWCEASRDFSSSVSGDVKVIAANANPNRVFAQVEIPTALNNPNVRSLGGVPVKSLRATYAERGVEGVLARVQANYIREAALAGLLPVPKSELPVGLRRSPGTTLRAATVAARGLGVGSAVASAYDGVATARHVAQLHEQGNDTGAQSHIVGAVSRSVGGLGGFTLGATTGAALTAETAPGAIIGGALGGIAGALAGDELAAWMDHRRIYRQNDAAGHAWSFDPAQPAQGWTRTTTLDQDTHVSMRQTLTAPSDLADRLNYQASTTAIELALSAPRKANDPFLQPSTHADHRPGNLYEGDWRRDAESGQWSRQVTDSHVGVSMQMFQSEMASPQRAAELDRQAQAVMAKNLETTPAAIAAGYRDAYERFAWSRHGAMPDAVHHAMRHPERMVASDGLTYARSDERWTTPGKLYGSRAAEPRIQAELDATDRQRLHRGAISKAPAVSSEEAQADSMIDAYFAALEAGDRDGMRKAARTFAESAAGRQIRLDVSRETLDEQRALPGRDNPLFVQAMKHIRDLGPDVARYRDEAGLERIAGAIAFEATRRGMGGIGAIRENADGDLLATWESPHNPLFRQTVTVDPTLAAIQPLDRSFQQIADETQQQAQQSLQREHALSQGRGMSR